MNDSLAAWLSVAVYLLGALGWLMLWKVSGFLGGKGKSRFLLIPFLLIFVNFAAQIASILYRPKILDFAVESNLIRVVEDNTLKIIIATFGLLVLSNSILIAPGRDRLPVDFIKFALFSIASILGGVSLILWVPGQMPEILFVLRHLKTVFYIFAIGFFLAALIELLDELRKGSDES